MSNVDTKPIIIGIGGHAVSVDPHSGRELWRTYLKSSSYVTIRDTDNYIFAGAAGILFCLDRNTGKIIWKNDLKGLGLGIISFSNLDIANLVRLVKAEKNSTT